MEKGNKNTLEQLLNEYNALYIEHEERKEKIKCVEVAFKRDDEMQTVECIYEGAEDIKQLDRVNVGGCVKAIGFVTAVFETKKENYRNLKMDKRTDDKVILRDYKTNRIDYFPEIIEKNGKKRRGGHFVVILDEDYDKPID